MSLLAVQREFAACLRAGDAASAGMRVYRNNYRASLVACLEEGFGRTRAWIGDAAFRDATIRHIDRVPPSSWTLDAYGRDFPDSLRLFYPDDPEVAELAWLEHALDEAFVGGDATPLTLADAAKVDWDDATLHFVPTIEIGAITTNAPALWSALAADETPPAAIERDAHAALLVWRRDHVAHFRVLDAPEEHALVQAQAGMSFAALCEAIVAANGEAEGIALAGAWLGRWLADGLLTSATGNRSAERA